MGTDRNEGVRQSRHLESGKRPADGRSENAVTVNRAIDDLTREITGHYDRIKNSLGVNTAGAGQKRGQGHRTETAHPAGTLQEHNEEFKKRVGIDRRGNV